MPTATDELESREATFNRKLERFNKEKEDFQRQSDNMKAEILAGLKKETEYLAKLKAEIGPKIAVLEQSKKEAAAEVDKLRLIRDEVTKQQGLHSQAVSDHAADAAGFSKEKSEFASWKKDEAARLENERALANGMTEKARILIEVTDKRNADEALRLQSLASSVEKAKAEQADLNRKAAEFHEEAKRKELILTGQISMQRKQMDERQTALDARSNTLDAQQKALDAQEKSMSEREFLVKQDKDRIEAAQKTLDTANLHLQNRELKFKKAKSEVELLVENSNLSEELKGKTKAKVNEPGD